MLAAAGAHAAARRAQVGAGAAQVEAAVADVVEDGLQLIGCLLYTSLPAEKSHPGRLQPGRRAGNQRDAVVSAGASVSFFRDSFSSRFFASAAHHVVPPCSPT